MKQRWWQIVYRRPHLSERCPFTRAGQCPYHRTSVHIIDAARNGGSGA